MDIVNYYLGEDTGLGAFGAEANPTHPGPAQSFAPTNAGAPVVFSGALTYLGGGDAGSLPGQWAYGPVTGTVLDVTA